MAELPPVARFVDGMSRAQIRTSRVVRSCRVGMQYANDLRKELARHYDPDQPAPECPEPGHMGRLFGVEVYADPFLEPDQLSFGE